MESAKELVKEFWQQAACGENALLSSPTKEGFQRQSELRYQLEPFILEFAGFDKYRGKKVLEIGVGLGADHQKFAEAGAVLYGIAILYRLYIFFNMCYN